MNNLEVKQGTEEWRQLRMGKVTASRVADVVARTKTGYGASRANLMATLICERLTGQPQESYTNSAMQWGTDTEPKARAAYSYFTDNEVIEVGFVSHPTIEQAGASPDGVIGEDGLLEIKCPNTAGHIDFLLGEPIPDKYIKQMSFQMACTGRKWVDYCSFDPRLPQELQMKIERVHRDDKLIAMLEDEVRVFLLEVESKLSQLTKLAAAA